MLTDNEVLKEANPGARFLVDEKPPIGKRVWMVSRHGAGFAGAYHPEYDVMWWSYLPALTPEQHARKEQLLKEMEDLPKPEPEPEHPMGCAWKS